MTEAGSKQRFNERKNAPHTLAAHSASMSSVRRTRGGGQRTGRTTMRRDMLHADIPRACCTPQRHSASWPREAEHVRLLTRAALQRAARDAADARVGDGHAAVLAVACDADERVVRATAVRAGADDADDRVGRGDEACVAMTVATTVVSKPWTIASQMPTRSAAQQESTR